MDIPIVASFLGQGCQAIPRRYLVFLRERGPKIFSSPPELAWYLRLSRIPVALDTGEEMRVAPNQM